MSYVQLSMFGEVEEPKQKKMFYVSALDDFDRRKEDYIEAYSYEQACYLFREKYGWYWKPHG